ncbi:hypothetical protein Ssi02_44700 [Sinosporangium siamense]|uniref:Uncharacterized protein n=1 Tax=Sinosporangium siamense TaxID=1367973 RepID=A0A919RLN6_9ACTN|nr:hypothetical protein Ssi02_44700 [Sinosporangium siamense]
MSVKRMVLPDAAGAEAMGRVGEVGMAGVRIAALPPALDEIDLGGQAGGVREVRRQEVLPRGVGDAAGPSARCARDGGCRVLAPYRRRRVVRARCDWAGRMPVRRTGFG